jgi:hypothetical protein
MWEVFERSSGGTRGKKTDSDADELIYSVV